MILVKSILNKYRRLLQTNLILVQSVQAGILYGAGDTIAQVIVEKKSRKEIDLYRTFGFVTVGTCLIGPAVTTWYKFLSKTIGDKGKFAALKKVAADQILFTPPFQMVIIVALNIVQGRDFQFIKDQLRLKYTDILIAGYKLWPMVQIINFYFVPLAYQVFLVQCVGLFWNTYLSWKTQYGIN